MEQTEEEDWQSLEETARAYWERGEEIHVPVLEDQFEEVAQ